MKSRPCAQCNAIFTPQRMGQHVCSPMCGLRLAKAYRLAKVAADKLETKQRKEKIKTLPVLKRETQVVFNRWIRARDETQPCISCGAAAPSAHEYQGGRDAGHYRSVGAAPHLRYHEDNVHAQCVSCNQHKSGNAVDYRIGLLARLGVARVEAVEHDNTARRYTREELIAIKAEYKAKLKAMKA